MVRTHKYIAKATNTKYNKDAILHNNNTSRESYLFGPHCQILNCQSKQSLIKGWGDTKVLTHDHVTIGEATNDKLEPTIDQ